MRPQLQAILTHRRLNIVLIALAPYGLVAAPFTPPEIDASVTLPAVPIEF